ncbi:MAG TPA: response regulator transcription factor [Actinomycetota bacterium]
MEDDVRARVWVDDRNAIFRRGLVGCLHGDGFRVAGESANFEPEPDPSRIDVLLFDLEDDGLQRAVRIASAGDMRLVGIARAAREETLLDAVQAGLAGFLVRSELTPAGLASSLRAVVAGNGTLPPALLGRLVDSLARGGPRGTAGQLAARELGVLRLLAEGNDTRDIALKLSYSERTVKNIVHDLLVKMNCRSRAHAVALATRRGVI